MTVCIAARCKSEIEDEELVVTVSDTKLTQGYYSADMATLKLRHITDTWKCLISGKFAQHRLLVEKTVEETKQLGIAPSYSQMSKFCTNAFISENKRMAEESVLSTYGLTMQDFVKSREALGDALFERLWADISRVKVDCELLVCGFDAKGLAHICVVGNPSDDNPSFVTDRDFPGFATIGTGGYLADSSLYGASQGPAETLQTTIYNTMVAKFLSESATDVGEQTYIYIFNHRGEKILLDGLLEYTLRKQWLEHKNPGIPSDMWMTIRDAIPKELREEEETDEKSKGVGK